MNVSDMILETTEATAKTLGKIAKFCLAFISLLSFNCTPLRIRGEFNIEQRGAWGNDKA